MPNLDPKTVAGFGAEWSRFDQTPLEAAERQEIFDRYFAVFPWDALPQAARGLDFGCGSGRWDVLLAPRVGHLICADASADALERARQALALLKNVSFHEAGLENLEIQPGSLDFVVSLGVLHHLPDTGAAITSLARLLKPGGVMLLYLYYRFDNRGRLFYLLWWMSDCARRLIARLPTRLRHLACEGIAALVYWPLARLALVAARLGLPAERLPLAFYRDKSFYVMRTDALDRFGTRLEQRFTRREIARMLDEAGLEAPVFSPHAPYWCVAARTPRPSFH